MSVVGALRLAVHSVTAAESASFGLGTIGPTKHNSEETVKPEVLQVSRYRLVCVTLAVFQLLSHF